MRRRYGRRRRNTRDGFLLGERVVSRRRGRVRPRLLRDDVALLARRTRRIARRSSRPCEPCSSASSPACAPRPCAAPAEPLEGAGSPEATEVGEENWIATQRAPNAAHRRPAAKSASRRLLRRRRAIQASRGRTAPAREPLARHAGTLARSSWLCEQTTHFLRLPSDMVADHATSTTSTVSDE